jgi:hypothetical protein
VLLDQERKAKRRSWELRGTVPEWDWN